MLIHYEFIPGCSLGIKFFNDDFNGTGFLIDLLIVRFIFFKD